MGQNNASADLFQVPDQHLKKWAPESWPVAPDWQPVISRFLSSEAARHLARFVEGRLAAGATIFPCEPLRALALTPLSAVKVVILGQDPYHGPGQAHGLAFSVRPGVAVPPSLRNIFKEITRDPAVPKCGLNVSEGTLERWSKQGVLLLNCCLTVEQGQPASHEKQGWEVLTDEIIKTICELSAGVVFMLWGKQAQGKLAFLSGDGFATSGVERRHLVLTANHPSPLSALRPPIPFLGCGHFSQANAFLARHGKTPIIW